MLKSLAEQNIKNHEKKQFMPIFFRAPKSIKGNEIEFNITKLENNRAVLSEATEILPADLVLRSVGYKSTRADGGIFFNEERGLIDNLQGMPYYALLHWL